MTTTILKESKKHSSNLVRQIYWRSDSLDGTEHSKTIVMTSA